MREHRLRQVNTGIRYSLPLCLVNRHGEAEPNRKLLPLELKREHLIIRGAKWDPWQEDPLSSMLTQNNFCIDDILLESSNHQPHAIAKSVCGVNVLKQYDRAVYLQLQQMWRQTVGVNVFRKSDG